MSSPPPASPPMVWPPSNPSGTVIPFPLPWGQTGCCPPGGMDALMKCYCDIQQASAFIGQVMLDQINNNPAIIAAIIAGIEKSGSTLPTLGVTNGSDAQPGQVGEWVLLAQTSPYLATATSVVVSLGVLQPGDWDCWTYATGTIDVNDVWTALSPVPPGFSYSMLTWTGVPAGPEPTVPLSPTTRALISVPTLIPLSVNTNVNANGPGAGTWTVFFAARRAR